MGGIAPLPRAPAVRFSTGRAGILVSLDRRQCTPLVADLSPSLDPRTALMSPGCCCRDAGPRPWSEPAGYSNSKEALLRSSNASRFLRELSKAVIMPITSTTITVTEIPNRITYNKISHGLLSLIRTTILCGRLYYPHFPGEKRSRETK